MRVCRVLFQIFLLPFIIIGAAAEEPMPSPTAFLPEGYAEAGRIIAEENTDALVAVMRKAERKEPVTIAVIGGSITEGTISRGEQDREYRARKPYATLFFDWWRQKFPGTEFHFINAGIGATNSYLGVHRVQRDVLDQHPDLVLIEFSVNDESSMKAKIAYDNLVRRILQDEAEPAVILMLMAQTNGASAQVPHAAVGKHYRLPMISYKNVIERLIADGVYSEDDLSGDEVHPSALGHMIAGGLLRLRLDEVYAERMDRPNPVAFDMLPATKEMYRNARIRDSSDLIPEETGTFKAKNVFSRFPNGWQTTGGKGGFVFTESFATLGVVWLKQTNGKNGRADIYVDGICKATLDGDFTGGWGDYAETKEIYTSREPSEHRVEIIMHEGSEDKCFTILGFLTAD